MSDDTTHFSCPKGCAYKSPTGDRVVIESFDIRETDGDDEERAANTAKGKGGSATAVEELIQISLVAINDEPVNVGGKPYNGFVKWNSKARNMAQKAWTAVNAGNADESEAFLARAAVV